MARDRVIRYIIVNEASNRIVATTAGTHGTMQRLVDRLMERKGGTYFYDDVSAASLYQPQVGPNVALSVGGRTMPSRVAVMW